MKNKKILPTKDSVDEDVVYRMWSVISYFFVLIIIGIPIWWYTTRVYRAALPINKMLEMEVSDTSLNKYSSVPLSLEYDILVTIVNPDPENIEVDLNGNDIATYLEPFLKNISDFATFVVKSQWLYLVELGAIPRKIEEHYVITEDQLPHVITPLEKKLFAHLSPRPCINLILYIPHCKAPLYILDKNNKISDTNAFISSRWGGIYLLNPDKESCQKKVFQPDMQMIVSTLTSQLRTLFSIKGSSNSDFQELKMEKVVRLIDSSKRTLRSLAQLLSEISSIVISDDVAQKVHTAVKSIELAESYINKNLELSLDQAKIAYNHSEAAFSDPSLLALLYFPEDQKYAVYIPLFLPIMIPVFMSLITLRKLYTKHKKLKTE